MLRSIIVFPVLLLLLSTAACGDPPVTPGAYQMEDYLPLLKEKKIALVSNHTSMVGGIHLVDTLLSSGITREQILKVFAPEHGFRGDQADGQRVEDGLDPVTGIAVASLYGENKKPSPGTLEGVELILFDLQDVGARFYTYISTLHYVMEACAEQEIPLILLDRPNPNRDYVDGPMLEEDFTSFVGMHPIPVVYGLTIGELARMINGEGWLTGGVTCELTVIPCRNYSAGTEYTIPVSPSPNLSTQHAIRLYPSTCFFEGTVISEGRGTPWPFEVYGHPDLNGEFSFTPERIPGVSEYPKHEGVLCYGRDLRTFVPPGGWDRIRLEWLLDAYHQFPRREEFFKPYFEKLAGTARLREQIESGWDEERIRESWKPELDRYLRMREGYLIYD